MKSFFCKWKYFKGDFLRPNIFRKIAAASFLTTSLYFRHTVNCNNTVDEEDKLREIEVKRQIIREINKQLQSYDVGPSQLVQEGKIYPMTIKNEDKDYKILLVRYKDKAYSVSATCTYDLETDLSDGIVFGNKLYCPKHGCQYDITNGLVEHAPAIDNLPRFIVEERENKLRVLAPPKIPRKIIPYMSYRDYNDLRKVVIIGSGSAGYACVQTMREFQFTGQVVIITKEDFLPYDKTKLSKQIKGTQPSDFFLRPEQWYEDQQIDVVTGREVMIVNNKYQNNYVEVDDSTRFEYDGLLVATGTTSVHRNIQGIKESKNVHYLDTLTEHQRFKEALETTKKLAIVGINWEALETAATIRREYPHIDVTILDINHENYIKSTFGQVLSDSLLKLHQENKVKVLERVQIESVEEKNDRRLIQLTNGKKLVVDTLLLIPNNSLANTEFLQDTNENVEFDSIGRLKVDFNLRSDVKRIFSAGNCSSAQYYLTADRYQCRDWNAAFQQGITVAYNFLALNVPWFYIPQRYTEQYGKVLQRVGAWNKFDKCHIIGDINSWDFVILYGWNDMVIGALGTANNKNYVNIINEMLRLQIKPYLSEFENNKLTFEQLADFLREQKRSGCYKGPILSEKDNPLEQFSIWQYRDDWADQIDKLNPKEDVKVDFRTYHDPPSLT